MRHSFGFQKPLFNTVRIMHTAKTDGRELTHFVFHQTTSLDVSAIKHLSDILNNRRME